MFFFFFFYMDTYKNVTLHIAKWHTWNNILTTSRRMDKKSILYKVKYIIMSPTYLTFGRFARSARALCRRNST